MPDPTPTLYRIKPVVRQLLDDAYRGELPTESHIHEACMKILAAAVDEPASLPDCLCPSPFRDSSGEEVQDTNPGCPIHKHRVNLGTRGSARENLAQARSKLKRPERHWGPGR